MVRRSLSSGGRSPTRGRSMTRVGADESMLVPLAPSESSTLPDTVIRALPGDRSRHGAVSVPGASPGMTASGGHNGTAR